jgi:ATP-dependent exoDNAse (exonuclease V) beta subunit
MRTYLDDNRGKGVDGRSFGSWLTTSFDRTDIEGVEVMTFHSAKGRQWWGVVVAGAEEGLLPHSSARSRQQRAEEARLGYVAFTRAADELVVTWATRRKGKTRRRSPLLPVSATVVTSQDGPGDDVRRLSESAPRVHPLVTQLRAWRESVARRTRLEPAGILTDPQIDRIVAERPATADELAAITDRSFAARHGASLLGLVNPPG